MVNSHCKKNNNSSSKTKQLEKGFTLVEVLVAMTIIMIVLTAYTVLFTTSFEGIYRAGQKSEELFWAQGNIETLIAMREEGEGQVIVLEFKDGGRQFDVWGRTQEVSSFKTFLSEEKDPIRYVTVGSYSLLVSPLGATWTAVDNAALYTVDFVDIVWGGVGLGDKGYLAIGNQGQLYFSNDGNIWEVRPALNGLNSWNAVTWGGIWGDYTVGIEGDFKYVAVGNSGAIMYSTDTENWSPADSVYQKDLYGVGFGGIDQTQGHFVSVGVGGTILTWSGKNEEQWSDHSLGINNSEVWPNLNDLVWAEGRFVAVGDSGLIVTSTDAENWTVVSEVSIPINSEGSTVNINSIAYGIGYFVAVGEDSTILISSDGLIWSDVSIVSSNRKLLGVTWSYNRFVAVGDGLILTSRNATDWVEIPGEHTTSLLRSVTGR